MDLQDTGFGWILEDLVLAFNGDSGQSEGLEAYVLHMRRASGAE